jgi:hypothetical protein
MSRRKCSALVVLLVATTGAVLSGSSVLLAQQSPGLFIEAAGPKIASGDQLAAADRTRVRSRTVRIDFPQLGTRDARSDVGTTLLLNLFPDVSYTAVLDRIDRTTRGFVWVGHIPGVDMSTVTLGTEDGVMSGSILTAAGTYEIRFAGSGLHTIAQIDQDAFRPEAQPREVDLPPGAANDVATGTATPQGDDASFIDVMVLYTSAAAAAAGGTSAMNSLIASSISVTNTSYSNSNVPQRVRLVYSAPIAYTESGDIQTDLDNVTNGAGAFSGVPALRNSYAADLVALMTNTPGSAYCGIAWLMASVSSGFASSAYSVVEQSCAVGALTFPHELGHNMGLRHDWYVDNHTTPYSYAHGHVNVGTTPTTRWVTIMSYKDKCFDQGVSCTRLPYWSNPSLTYFGTAMGVPGGTSTACALRNVSNPACDADDHLALNNTALTVANFRHANLAVTSLTSNVTFPVPAGTLVTWTAAVSGGTAPYTYKFFVSDGSQWTVGQDWSASSTWAWTPLSAGTYSFQVWVRNAGSSTAFDAYLGVGPVSATGTTALNVTGLTANKSFPVLANTTVTWTATTSGGTGPYTYKFFVFNGSTWTVGQDWSATSTWTWTPSVPGDYSFQVWARNGGSAAPYDAWRGAGPVSVAAPAPLAIASLSSSPPSPVAIGSHVTWTAMATGGSGPYTFKFWVSDGSTWTLGRDWSATNTWTWTPAVAGSYSFQVWARNAGSATTYDAWRPASPFVVSAPTSPTVTTLTANQVFPVPAGTPVTWTATASGGTGPYTYKFLIFNGSTWSLGQDWSAANTFEWTPSAAGDYSFQVWVRNAGSGTTFDGWAGFGTYGVTALAPLGVTSLTADRMFPVPAGTPVTWTALARGGSGPYTYKFLLYNGSAWTVGADWSASSSWTLVPPAAGAYSLQVWVRNVGSASTYDAWLAAGPAFIGAPAALSVTSVTLSPAAPLLPGTPASLGATATGGTGPYTYKFFVYDGAAWTVGQDWSTASTFNWVPPGTGSYWFQVWVRNAGSITTWDAWAGLGPSTTAADRR